MPELFVASKVLFLLPLIRMPFQDPTDPADNDLNQDVWHYFGFAGAAMLSTIPSPRTSSPHDTANLENSPPIAQFESLPFLSHQLENHHLLLLRTTLHPPPTSVYPVHLAIQHP